MSKAETNGARRSAESFDLKGVTNNKATTTILRGGEPMLKLNRASTWMERVTTEHGARRMLFLAFAVALAGLWSSSPARSSVPDCLDCWYGGCIAVTEQCLDCEAYCESCQWGDCSVEWSQCGPDSACDSDDPEIPPLKSNACACWDDPVR